MPHIPLSGKALATAAALTLGTALSADAATAPLPPESTAHTISVENQRTHDNQKTAVYNPNFSVDQDFEQELVPGVGDGAAEIAFVTAHKQQLKDIFAQGETSPNFVNDIVNFIDKYSDPNPASTTNKNFVTRAIMLMMIFRNESPEKKTISDATIKKLRLTLSEAPVSEAYHIYYEIIAANQKGGDQDGRNVIQKQNITAPQLSTKQKGQEN